MNPQLLKDAETKVKELEAIREEMTKLQLKEKELRKAVRVEVRKLWSSKS